MIPHTLCLMPTRRNKPPHRCPACIVRRTDSPKNLFLKHCKLQLVQQRKTIDGPYLLRRVFRGFALLCQDFQFPDITGEFNNPVYGNMDHSQPTGCFYYHPDSLNGLYGATNKTGDAVAIQANKSSVLFGNSSTIQPLAFHTLMIVKIWQAETWTTEDLP